MTAKSLPPEYLRGAARRINISVSEEDKQAIEAAAAAAGLPTATWARDILLAAVEDYTDPAGARRPAPKTPRTKTSSEEKRP